MKITLSKQVFELPEEFTLGQLRRIAAKVAGFLNHEPDQEKRTEQLWQRQIDIILISLQPKYSHLSEAVLDGMTISKAEMSQAYETILIHGGFISKKEPKPGEVGAETASIGDGSIAV